MRPTATQNSELRTQNCLSILLRRSPPMAACEMWIYYRTKGVKEQAKFVKFSGVKKIDRVRPSPYSAPFPGRLAQLARAPALQAGGHRSESCTAHENPIPDAGNGVFSLYFNFARPLAVRSSKIKGMFFCLLNGQRLYRQWTKRDFDSACADSAAGSGNRQINMDLITPAGHAGDVHIPVVPFDA